MLTLPCAKINLGLNIIAERADGYHDLQTVFYPIPLNDVLEIKLMDPSFPHDYPCDLKVTGNAVDCDEQCNLVVKAYSLLAADFDIPPIHAHLYKRIPSQAGLGGGSSDGAYMIRLLDERFRLNIGIAEMERYAALLGSDCPFFITSEPSFATGRGDILSPVDGPRGNLNGYYIAVVCPQIAVSTRAAYENVKCKMPEKSCKDIVRQPIASWKGNLTNDFEDSVFAAHPQLVSIKQKLYDLGALYAQMNGSGSSLYGIFNELPPQEDFNKVFEGCFTFTSRL